MITVNWVVKYISAPNINRDDVVWCEADTKCKNKYIKPLTNHAYHLTNLSCIHYPGHALREPQWLERLMGEAKIVCQTVDAK